MIWAATLVLALAGQVFEIKVPTMGESACIGFINEIYATAPRILEIREAGCTTGDE